MGVDQFRDVDKYLSRINEIYSDDGYLLKYRVWSSECTTNKVVFLLNGVMSHSEWFNPMIPFFIAAGYKVIGADRRGSGLNRLRSGDAENTKVVFADLSAIIIKESKNAEKVHLIGWCWGAALAINMVSILKNSLCFNTLTLLAPGLFPSQSIINCLEEQKCLQNAMPIDSICLTSPITEDMFTRGPWLENYIESDHLRLKLFSPRFFMVMEKIVFGSLMLLKKITIPTNLILATNDEATDNYLTVNKFKCDQPDANIIYLHSAHGMQFEIPMELAGEIISWIEKQ